MKIIENEKSYGTVLITGGSSGIGYNAASRLANLNINLILPCRDIKTSNKTRNRLLETSSGVNNNLRCTFPVMDLADIQSISNFAREVVSKYQTIDTLVFNAGLQYTGSITPRKTKQNIELTFGVNHVAHQLLINMLYPALNKSKKPHIIITSSEVHNPSSSGGSIGKSANAGSLNGIKSEELVDMIDGSPIFNADKAYKDSKLCNILFSRALNRIFNSKKTAVPITTWAPGLVIPRGTNGFFRYSREYNMLGQTLFAFIARDVLHITETVENAGLILSNLILDKYNREGFKYYVNNLEFPGIYSFKTGKISEEASNDKLMVELWNSTQDIIKARSNIKLLLGKI